MTLTDAKPFLKNISDKIHSKALADDTQTILSLKTEGNLWEEHKQESELESVTFNLTFRLTSQWKFKNKRKRQHLDSPSWSFVRHRTAFK